MSCIEEALRQEKAQLESELAETKRDNDRLRTSLSQLAQSGQQDYLGAFRETALDLINRLELSDLLEAILHRAGRLVEAPLGFFNMLDEKKLAMRLVAKMGFPTTEEWPPVQPGLGLAGRVWQQGQAVLIDDYQTWAYKRDLPDFSVWHAAVGIPLKSAGEVIGVIGLGYTDPARQFEAYQVELLSHLAELASLALDNARLHTTARRRLAELTTLQEATQAINSNLELNEVLQTVVQQVNEAFGYQMVTLFLREDQHLRLAAQVGVTEVLPVMSLDQGVMGRVARTGQAAFLADVETDPDFIRLSADLRQLLVTPLKSSHGQVLGTLAVGSKGEAWLTEDDLRLLQLVADQVSLAVSNARLFEERIKLERRLLEAQKLESLGVLAGGIAHDFNNLLVGILGNTELARLELPPYSPVRDTLDQLEIAARRAADLTGQMLAYSGRGQFVVEPVDFNRLLSELSQLLKASLPKNTVVTYQMNPDLPLIKADATQLRQLALNLIINSGEAIGEGPGLITVRTGTLQAERTDLDATYLSPTLEPGRYVYLEVTDTGSGMDEATMSKIFEPFFTTRFTGRGLGLAATLGIVRGHQGAIKVTSQPGEGSTFRVLFPALASATEEAQRGLRASKREEGEGRKMEDGGAGQAGAKVSRPATPDPKGLLLVVDDEPMVLDMTCRVLERAGWETIKGHDGWEGVELFSRQPDQIECVLLDLTMPRLNGVDAVGQIRRLRPDARVILMSGYSEQEATAQFATHQLSGFIQKPFTLKDLVAVVRQVTAQP